MSGEFLTVDSFGRMGQSEDVRFEFKVPVEARRVGAPEIHIIEHDNSAPTPEWKEPVGLPPYRKSVWDGYAGKWMPPGTLIMPPIPTKGGMMKIGIVSLVVGGGALVLWLLSRR